MQIVQQVRHALRLGMLAEGDQLPTVTGCTLEVPTGHVAGLVGPNGAGKTTLLHLAVGLIEPSAGSIIVLGESATT
jgi:ABC-type multidrug transport system ATPase subunit